MIKLICKVRFFGLINCENSVKKNIVSFGFKKVMVKLFCNVLWGFGLVCLIFSVCGLGLVNKIWIFKYVRYVVLLYISIW